MEIKSPLGTGTRGIFHPQQGKGWGWGQRMLPPSPTRPIAIPRQNTVNQSVNSKERTKITIMGYKLKGCDYMSSHDEH